MYDRAVSDDSAAEFEEWRWDPKKAADNRRKHRVGFAEAVIALSDPLALTVLDEQRNERRMVTIGADSTGRLLVVAWAPRGAGGRIVSARRATARERHHYEDFK